MVVCDVVPQLSQLSIWGWRCGPQLKSVTSMLPTPGDQARTVMIANISPNNLSVEHSLNTLRYADRVKGEDDTMSRLSCSSQP